VAHGNSGRRPPSKLRGSCLEKLVGELKREPRADHECRDWAIEIAATEDEPIEAVQPLLPSLDAGIGRRPVFEQEVLAVRPEHAADLTQRALNVADGAEYERRHDGIE